MKKYILLFCSVIFVLPSYSMGGQIYPKSYSRDKQEIRADSVEKEIPLSLAFSIVNIPKFSGKAFVVNCENKVIRDKPANEILQYSDESSLGYMINEMCTEAVNEKNNRLTLSDAKIQCAELGFKPKTEKFGTCVLEIIKRGQGNTNVSAQPLVKQNYDRLREKELAIQAEALEEQKSANRQRAAEQESTNRQRALEQESANRQRAAEQESTNRQRAAEALINLSKSLAPQQSDRAYQEQQRAVDRAWDANQRKIENDWKYRD